VIKKTAGGRDRFQRKISRRSSSSIAAVAASRTLSKLNRQFQQLSLTDPFQLSNLPCSSSIYLGCEVWHAHCSSTP
jgi:hypothetical protein